jgi:predicted O-methyltransferase YrrM
VKLYSKLPAPRDRALYDMPIGRGVAAEEGALLFGIVRMLKPKVCIETGTLVGDSAFWIGLALRDNGFGCLVTCDTDKNRIEPAKERLKGLPVGVILQAGRDLIRTAGSKFDFVHIDSGSPAERLEELTILDEQNIAPGGIVCWHDACVGYTAMYDSFSAKHDWPHLVMPSVVGLAIFQRPE